MTVLTPSPYVLPGGDLPLTHARILHAGNWLSGGTATASDTATDFFANGPLNSLTYERWKPATLPATWEYDHGSAAAVDCAGIAAHTMGTNGNSLAVQYFNGSVWVDALASASVATDEPILVIFPPQTRQRWRISVSGGTAPEIGVVKFGKALQMQRTLYGGHTPVGFARMTELRANYSETGEFLGRTVQRTMRSTVYAWENLTAAWMRTNWIPLQKAVESEPFFIAWRPALVGDVGFVQVDQAPVPVNMGVRDLMSVELQVRGLGYD
jgi:hypothetical protein